MAPRPTQSADQRERQRQEALRRSGGGQIGQPSAAEIRAMQNAGMQGTTMTGRSTGPRAVSSSYSKYYEPRGSTISSPHYPTDGFLAPQAQMGTPGAGNYYYDPMRQVFINRTTGYAQPNSPVVGQSMTPSPDRVERMQQGREYSGVRSAETWSGGNKLGSSSMGGYGTRGGKGGKGGKFDPNAGKTLPNLPPELERWYQEQLSRARTLEEQELARARMIRRSALLQSAEDRRSAARSAAGQAVDVGGALAGLGLGTSPALMGAALDQVYGAGGAGALSADSARISALEQFLRDEQAIMDRGRRTTTDLEDWRALQVAALSDQNLANLIQGSPLGGGR